MAKEGLKRRAANQLARDVPDAEYEVEEPMRMVKKDHVLRAKRRRKLEAGQELKRAQEAKEPASQTEICSKARGLRIKGLNASFIRAAEKAFEHSQTYDMSLLFVQYAKHLEDIKKEEEKDPAGTPSEKTHQICPPSSRSEVQTHVEQLESTGEVFVQPAAPLRTEELLQGISRAEREAQKEEGEKEEEAKIKKEVAEILQNRQPPQPAAEKEEEKDPVQAQSVHIAGEKKVQDPEPIFSVSCKVFSRKVKKFEDLGFHKVLVVTGAAGKKKEKILQLEKNDAIISSVPVRHASIRSPTRTKELAFVDPVNSLVYKVKLASLRDAGALRKACGMEE